MPLIIFHKLHLLSEFSLILKCTLFGCRLIRMVIVKLSDMLSMFSVPMHVDC